jgi:hypothetical protein
MNTKIYNSALGIGLLSTSLGAGMQWGLGIGLMVAGVLVMVLTFAGAYITHGGRV